MILMVTEEAVTIREYRFRLVQNCKNAVKCRLLPRRPYPIGRGTPPFKPTPSTLSASRLDAFGISSPHSKFLATPLAAMTNLLTIYRPISVTPILSRLTAREL